MWVFALWGCEREVLSDEPVDSGGETPNPCLTAEGFDLCFSSAWCAAWDACGFAEPCADVQPWTTHYESDNGTMTLDCEDVEDPDYAGCLALPPASTCDELRDAAQLDQTNGPWIDTCILRSCV
jgi:hypothetical protein